MLSNFFIFYFLFCVFYYLVALSAPLVSMLVVVSAP